MVTCMPSMAAVYRHAHPKLHKAFSATYQKLRSQNTSQKTEEMEDESRVELRPVDHDRSNYKKINEPRYYP